MTLVSHPLSVSATAMTAHLRSQLLQEPAWNDLTFQHSMRARFWPSAIQVSKTLTIWTYNWGVISDFSLCCYLGKYSQPFIHDQRAWSYCSLSSQISFISIKLHLWSVSGTEHDNMGDSCFIGTGSCADLLEDAFVCVMRAMLWINTSSHWFPILLSLDYTFKCLLQNI